MYIAMTWYIIPWYKITLKALKFQPPNKKAHLSESQLRMDVMSCIII